MTKPDEQMSSDEQIAKEIAAIAPLPYETALEALKAGGHTRELALSILESNAAYAEDLRGISEARERLRISA